MISANPLSRAVEFAADKMTDIVPFLKWFGVSQTHVHHFYDIPDQVSSFLRRLGVPYDLSIHDYMAICPRINLLKGEQSYLTELSQHPRADLCYIPGDHERFRLADMAAALVATGCDDLRAKLAPASASAIVPDVPTEMEPAESSP